MENCRNCLQNQKYFSIDVDGNIHCTDTEEQATSHLVRILIAPGDIDVCDTIGPDPAQVETTSVVAIFGKLCETEFRLLVERMRFWI